MNKYYWLVYKDVVDYLPDIFHCELENLQIWKNAMDDNDYTYISYNEETKYYGFMPYASYIEKYYIDNSYIYMGILDIKYLRRKKLERIKIL